MNYQKKYLKYKAKYFQQKFQLDGGANQTVKVKTPKGEIISLDMEPGATIKDLKNQLSLRSECKVFPLQFKVFRDGMEYTDDKSISEILASPGSDVFMVRVSQGENKDARLIVFHGLSGLGKDTVADAAIEILKRKGKKVVKIDQDMQDTKSAALALKCLEQDNFEAVDKYKKDIEANDVKYWMTSYLNCLLAVKEALNAGYIVVLARNNPNLSHYEDFLKFLPADNVIYVSPRNVDPSFLYTSMLGARSRQLDDNKKNVNLQHPNSKLPPGLVASIPIYMYFDLKKFLEEREKDNNFDKTKEVKLDYLSPRATYPKALDGIVQEFAGLGHPRDKVLNVAELIPLELHDASALRIKEQSARNRLPVADIANDLVSKLMPLL